jgi:nucleoside-diphosphate-sugar epimerase
MKIFVAGATGAIGRQLVPRLVARGHEVGGTTRTPAKFDQLRRQGATPFLVDGLDAEQVAAAVAAFEPEVIVHELTDLGRVDFRQFARSFAMTNRLRTMGTDHLLAAGRAVGIHRFVAQSFAGWAFPRSGSWIKTEDEPLDLHPIEPIRETVEAIRYVERATLEADWTEGVVLRYGGLYGPGTGVEPGGEMLELIRGRKMPIIGDGAGIWSFLHIEDAAEATVLAAERGSRGIYQITDDEPARVAEWLPVVSRRLGAKPPMRVPRWLGRLLAGEAAVVAMTEVRGASNAKAKRELGWTPRHNWRTSLGAAEPAEEGATKAA